MEPEYRKSGDRLRHSKFVGLREDKGPKAVVREHGDEAYLYWLHSWWWFRAQTSALQQATPFLGATNRGATAIPAIAISRNTSTLNGTFTGDRRFTSFLFPQKLEEERYCASLRQQMVPRYRRASTFGTAANALHGSGTHRSVGCGGTSLPRKRCKC
jgi:hypothetical protein